jgi:hypothetical protein
MNDLYEELKVLGSGTNGESNLPSIPTGSITAYNKGITHATTGMDNDKQLLLPNMGYGLLFNKETDKADNEGIVISHNLDLRQMNTDMDNNGLIFFAGLH